MTEKKEVRSKKLDKWANALRWAVNTLVIFIVGITVLLSWDYVVTGGTRDYFGGRVPENTVVRPIPTEQTEFDAPVRPTGI